MGGNARKRASIYNIIATGDCTQLVTDAAAWTFVADFHLRNTSCAANANHTVAPPPDVRIKIQLRSFTLDRDTNAEHGFEPKDTHDANSILLQETSELLAVTTIAHLYPARA